ncbi:hypothetical protein [Candidatus Tisiphia endosymbiont of Piscicola geometra]|uniref:hypothetical protein n=1 Tax=Candidatus Tisiphia endosymbiont of Piscicola geometra TaxID=3066273 RepID=UPI00312C8399
MKSRTSSEPLSSITSVKNAIKPELTSLFSRYNEALTKLDSIINTSSGSGSHLLRSDAEYVGATKRVFEAIKKGTECEHVEMKGHGTHLNQQSDPYEMLHVTFCGKQGKHFMEMLDHYCASNVELKYTLTTFVRELNTTLKPFVSELHKCKVSHTVNGLDIEFASYSVAHNMKKYYAIKAGGKDQLKVIFDNKMDPLELQGDHIIVRHSQKIGDVGVFKGGDGEVAVSLHNTKERDALKHLFDGSNLVRTYSNPKALYFSTKNFNPSLCYDEYDKSVEFIGHTEVCGGLEL